jgi:prophage regulatory protein
MSKILRLPEVIELCAISRSSLYQFIKDDKFPKPIRLGERAVGWLESEISGWISERAEERGGRHGN